ncbi:MAG: hypothetical protein DI539_15135 [Flavobacterium psychrophilum]|nr:MAG: hypothetical protein DI539_15135 [Flavobacterium psychrophilum]
MKNSFFTGLTRLGVFAIAITGAFMTTAMGRADSFAIVNGHLQTGNPFDPCDETSVMCNTETTSEVCRVSNGGAQLYQLNSAPTSCNTTLWKIQP